MTIEQKRFVALNSCFRSVVSSNRFNFDPLGVVQLYFSWFLRGIDCRSQWTRYHLSLRKSSLWCFGNRKSSKYSFEKERLYQACPNSLRRFPYSIPKSIHVSFSTMACSQQFHLLISGDSLLALLENAAVRRRFRLKGGKVLWAFSDYFERIAGEQLF